MENKEFKLIDLLFILFQNRKKIILITLLISIIAFIASFALPRWYTSSATLLPPSEDSAGMGLSSLVGSLSLGSLGTGFGLNTLSEEANMFLAIINSRTVLESVVKRFELKDKYKVKTMQEAIKGLGDHIAISINEEGTITLSVEASTGYFPTSPKIEYAKLDARDMVQYFLAELERLNRDIKTQKARNTRIFIEKRYKKNMDDLEKSEEDFREFQKKYGTIDLPEQIKATITAAAEIKAQLILKEATTTVMEQEMQKTHPTVVKAKRELAELQRLYEQFKDGDGTADDKAKILLPLADVPDMGIEYLRLFREVKLQEKIMEFILPQYEQAKIQEEKDTPTVQVLDQPQIPELKTRPKRALIAAIVGLCTFFVLIIICIIIERINELQKYDNEQYQKISKIINGLKSDIRLSRKTKSHRN